MDRQLHLETLWCLKKTSATWAVEGAQDTPHKTEGAVHKKVFPGPKKVFPGPGLIRACLPTTAAGRA